jgi:hypothetical protein
MNAIAPTAVYLLCLLTSILCAGLLLRAYFRDRSRLLLWVAASFVCFALNNTALVADMVVFPAADLLLVRQITSIAAVAILIYAFGWEIES